MKDLKISVKGPYRGDFNKTIPVSEQETFSHPKFLSLEEYLNNLNIDDLCEYFDIDTVKDGLYVEVLIGDNYSLWTRQAVFSLEDEKSGYVSKYELSPLPIRFQHHWLASTHKVKNRPDCIDYFWRDVNNITSSIFDRICHPSFGPKEIIWNFYGGNGVRLFIDVVKKGLDSGERLDGTKSEYFLVNVVQGFGYWTGEISVETIDKYFERNFVRFNPNAADGVNIYQKTTSSSIIEVPGKIEPIISINVNVDSPGVKFYE